MGWQDWVGFENLRAICKHTIHCSAAILSFMWISWLVRRGLGPGLLATCIEYAEGFVLAVMLLVFVVNIGYDLRRELIRNVKSGQFVFA
jgi:hypothetical protein